MDGNSSWHGLEKLLLFLNIYESISLYIFAEKLLDAKSFNKKHAKNIYD